MTSSFPGLGPDRILSAIGSGPRARPARPVLVQYGFADEAENGIAVSVRNEGGDGDVVVAIRESAEAGRAWRVRRHLEAGESAVIEVEIEPDPGASLPSSYRVDVRLPYPDDP